MLRLSQPTFELSLDIVSQYPESQVHGYGEREAIPPAKQLLVTLWYIGGKDGMIKTTDRFEISEYSVVLCRNRHSLIFQSVCDDNMIFLHSITGYPGSCHGARVLRNSSLWKKE